MPKKNRDRLDRSLVSVMAIAIGVIVANQYYLQPLLNSVRSDFKVSTTATTLLLALIQLGYALGLAFIVPLGDIWPRRRLIPLLFLVAAVAMTGASAMHQFVAFAVMASLIGLASVGGQMLIPMGADLAPSHERGRVLGHLMTGLIAGVLLSRTLAGILSEVVGWRGVYRIAAIALATTSVVLMRILPEVDVRPHLPYGSLILGGLHLMRNSPVIRRCCWLGGCVFGAVSALWSTLAFELSTRPFHYSNGAIGLFGIFGFAGIIGANLAGRMADANRTGTFTKCAAFLLPSSFPLIYFGTKNVWLLIVGIVVLDGAMQAISVTNQAIIHMAAPNQRSSVQSVYMVCFFIGAALASLLSGYAFARFGWEGTCIVGGLFGVAALVPFMTWRIEVVPMVSP